MKQTKAFFFAMLALAVVLASCNADNVSPNAGGPTGQGGSMARFAVAGNYLYTVDDSKLRLFDISSPGNPTYTKEMLLGIGIETIFPYQNKLFIGAQDGMYILNIQNPAEPQLLSSYQHVVSCDPVVTDGQYAYVTLSSSTTCRRGINELQILDLQNITAPKLIKQYPMTNPKGLGIDGNLLFVCDNGLKVYDATDVHNLQLKHHFNINAYDVIPNNGILLVIGSDGFYQYRYTGQEMQLLSKINVQPSGT